ncbi:hypothetical protein V6N11_064358 [Hibiscus sabdariffa]|uniref:Uncharacterized protein n=1 Tax=Hibiscus sabdariffa TaxID=183260 RepID=A0ABR2PND1_9ROSI
MILPNPKTKSNEDFICKVSAKSFNAADRRISKSLVIRDVVPPSINPQQQSLVSSTDSNKKSVTIVGTLEQGEISIPPDIFNIDAILCDSMQAVKVTGKLFFPAFGCHILLSRALHLNILLSFDVNGIGYDEASKSPKWNTLLEDEEDNYEYVGKESSDQIYLVKSSMENLYSIHKYLDFERKGGIEAHSTKRFGIFKLILDEGNGNLLGKKEANHIDRIIDSSSPVTASGDDQGRL